MKCNMGKSDRIMRGVVGVVVIAIGAYFESWWGAIGVIPLFTAVVRWCPIYVPFKLSTEKKPSEETS
jgi:Inner membrane protein YgaP-like, transmembrane domain